MLREGFPFFNRKQGREATSRHKAVYSPDFRIIETDRNQKVYIPNGVSISNSQRNWIRNRARLELGRRQPGSRSEWTGAHIEQVYIHHVTSMFYSNCHGISPLVYNHFSNLIGISRQEHSDYLHAGDDDLSDLYEQDKEEFARRLRKLNTQVLEGIENWNTAWDEELREIALERSERMLKIEPWPQSDGTKLTWRECRRLF